MSERGLPVTAKFEFAGHTVEDIVKRADSAFADFFAGYPYEIVDVDSHAIVSIAGKVMHWMATVTAERATL